VLANIVPSRDMDATTSMFCAGARTDGGPLSTWLDVVVLLAWLNRWSNYLLGCVDISKARGSDFISVSNGETKTKHATVQRTLPVK